MHIGRGSRSHCIAAVSIGLRIAHYRFKRRFARRFDRSLASAVALSTAPFGRPAPALPEPDKLGIGCFSGFAATTLSLSHAAWRPHCRGTLG
jgi:hypothetical protein